jgi:uncharacterized RDD family membrane protein YckC
MPVEPAFTQRTAPARPSAAEPAFAPPAATKAPAALPETAPGVPDFAELPMQSSPTVHEPTFAEEYSTEPSISLKAAPLPAVEKVAAKKIAPRSSALREEGVVRAEPAAMWRRSGAWLIDLTFIAALVAGFLFIAMSVIAPKNLTLSQQLTLLAVPGAALAGMLAFVYTTIFAFLWNGRTPGRRALGIHLVDNSGHAPGPMRALTRAGLSLVSFALFLSGFWLALFDRHGQTLHDKLTRTFVVRLDGV